MRHHNKNKKFGRERDQRRALLRSLVLSLIKNEKIEITIVRAKAIRPLVEKLITKAKSKSLAAQRLINERLGGNKLASKKLIKDIAPRFIGRQGGYTRITKLGRRKSDGSAMAVIELIK